MENKSLKFKVALGIVIVVLLVSLISGGSAVIKNYTPPDSASENVTADDSGDTIQYNDDVLNAVTGGYSGPPKLVASDDRVFYIPPEYCDGSYLKNFRVIGVNQSKAVITKDEKGNISDYSGAVVLYGFQTTYREDYGKNYDFDYEPYDYDVEYKMVDENATKDSDTANSADDTQSTDNTQDNTNTTSYSVSTSTKKNPNAVDDSGFKVATVVMEHEIGKDECKILYCDSGSCTVADLDLGKYNLVTNLNDSALTVCHNEKILVYNFNKEQKSYGTNEVYYYKLQDLFDSITFKNTLSDIGYCKVQYNVRGDVSYSASGWVNTWLSKMEKTKTNTVTNVQYLSNLYESEAKKDRINSNFIDMESFVKEQVEKAYSGYKSSGSGWASYKHSTSISDFGNYTYKATGKNQWQLTNSFKFNVQETSWIILAPKTYKGSADANVTITITPSFSLLTNYTYSINDMILTQYESSANENKYSIVMQMLVTPTSVIDEQDSMEPIEDFNQYAKDVNSKTEDSTPDGVEDSEDENDIKEDESDKEETLEKKISSKYITLNINLAQKSGTESVASTEVLSISNTAEMDNYFSQLKTKYKDEYNTNNANFNNETKTGAYVIPKQFTIDSINDFKKQFNDIKECCEKLAKAKKELAELETKRNDTAKKIEDNVALANGYADALPNYFGTDKTIDENTGYYKKLTDLLSAYNESTLETIDDNTIFMFVRDYAGFLYGCETYFKNFFTSTTSIDTRYRSLLTEYGFEYKLDNSTYKSLQAKIKDTSSDKNVMFNRLKKALGPMYTKEKTDITVDITDSETMAKYRTIDLSEFNSIKKFATDLYNDIDVSGEVLSKDLRDKLKDYTTRDEKIKYIRNNNVKFDGICRSIENLIVSTEVYENDTSTIRKLANLYADETGKKIYDSMNESISYTKTLNQYDLVDIPNKQAEIEKLEKELEELKSKYKATNFYVDLSWNGTLLTDSADYLVNNYTKYDSIIAAVDEYSGACTSLVKVDSYRTSADKVIADIKTLNTNANITGVLESMYVALINSTSKEKYGTNFDSLVYLYEHRNRFYADLTSSINYHAGIKSATTEQTNTEEVDKANVNINLIKESAASRYASKGINVIKNMSYTAVENDCQSLYDTLYSKFEKVTTQQNGVDTETCDVSVDDVRKVVYELLLDEYGITELTDYNADGSVATKVTLAKEQGSQGNVYEDAEPDTEATTEAVDVDVLRAVCAASSKLNDYTATLTGHYKNIKDIADDRFLNNGSLTDGQKNVIRVDNKKVDNDVTSDYNTGYEAAVEICSEMSQLVGQAKTYYDVREKAASKINSAQNKGLSVSLRDDKYYYDTYKQKCYEVDKINRLVYSAAKAKNNDERKTYVDEYNSTNWLIKDDITIDKDLTSAIVIKRTNLKTTYQKVDWNTSLIKGDVLSNTSSTPYELYQMNSNFCVGVSGNDAFVVPMGTQATVNVTSLNDWIKSQIAEAGITELENVAYGSNNGYDLLLFSGNNKWFMIAYTQTAGKVDVNLTYVDGYSGSYNLESDDAHFLEFDHTSVTGINQLFTTTLENGYQPYDIKLVTRNNGTIEKQISKQSNEPGDEKVGIGVSGAFFNSWSSDNGNVILLGYKTEDMLVANDEDDNEPTTYYEGDTETTTEAETREINEDDIYDAHIYVLQYDTKKAVGSGDGTDNGDIYDSSTGNLYDAGIKLEGPFGELLEGPVNLLTVALKAVMAIVEALAVLYCVHLGVKYSTAADPEEKKNAKKHIMWFLIAFVGTHILIVFLYLAAAQLKQWSYDVTETQTTAAIEEDDERLSLKHLGGKL